MTRFIYIWRPFLQSEGTLDVFIARPGFIRASLVSSVVLAEPNTVHAPSPQSYNGNNFSKICSYFFLHCQLSFHWLFLWAEQRCCVKASRERDVSRGCGPVLFKRLLGFKKSFWKRPQSAITLVPFRLKSTLASFFPLIAHKRVIKSGSCNRSFHAATPRTTEDNVIGL